jgi:hypothetical protein
MKRDIYTSTTTQAGTIAKCIDNYLAIKSIGKIVNICAERPAVK